MPHLALRQQLIVLGLSQRQAAAQAHGLPLAVSKGGLQQRQLACHPGNAPRLLLDLQHTAASQQAQGDTLCGCSSCWETLLRQGDFTNATYVSFLPYT
jgi:hypothetical protein